MMKESVFYGEVTNVRDVALEISIPLDQEGFIEMECDFCKNRFMIHQDVYECDDNINFFCPICGLPNKINTFFVPEILEKAQQMAVNYMLDELDQTLEKSIKQINKSGLIKMSIKKPKREVEKKLYTPFISYSKCVKRCCSIDVKITNIDIETGTYCPICGRME